MEPGFTIPHWLGRGKNIVKPLSPPPPPTCLHPSFSTFVIIILPIQEVPVRHSRVLERVLLPHARSTCTHSVQFPHCPSTITTSAETRQESRSRSVHCQSSGQGASTVNHPVSPLYFFPLLSLISLVSSLYLFSLPSHITSLFSHLCDQ